MENPDILKPATWLPPSDLAAADQWEMEVRDHVGETVDMMADIISGEGPQSVMVWAFLLETSVQKSRLAAITAHFLIAEAQRRVDGDRAAA